MQIESMNYTKMMEERCAAISEGDRVTWDDGGCGLLKGILGLGIAWYVQDLPVHRVWATQDHDYESLPDLEEGKIYFPTDSPEYRELMVEVANVAEGMLTDVIKNLDHEGWHGQKIENIEKFWHDRFCMGKAGEDGRRYVEYTMKVFRRGETGLEFGFTKFGGMPTVQWRVGPHSGLLRPFVTNLSDEKPEMVHTHKCICMKCGLDLDESEEIFFLDEGKPSTTDAVKCGCGKGVKTRFILATSGKRGLSKFTTNQPGSYGAVETTLHLPGCTNAYCSMPNRAITRRLFDQRGNDWKKLKKNVFRMEAREKARRKRRKN